MYDELTLKKKKEKLIHFRKSWQKVKGYDASALENVFGKKNQKRN